MKLLIDNLDNAGLRDYTPYLCVDHGPVIRRTLNRPDELDATLTGNPGSLRIPVENARVELVFADGSKLFTGYLSRAPEALSLGATERGPWNAYRLKASGDQYVLDRKPLPARPSFVQKPAGELLQELTDELCPGGLFDTSQIATGEIVPEVTCGGTRRWSDLAAEIASQTRSVVYVHDHEIQFHSLGEPKLVLDETDPQVDARALHVEPAGTIVNIATVLGGNEPGTYVRDEFCGDGYALTFPLSNIPYLSTPHTVLEEEFAGDLQPHLWEAPPSPGVFDVARGRLIVLGGNGDISDGAVWLRQSLELGGAWQLQHGELSVESGSGWIGSLFSGDVEPANCIAGFYVAESSIQPFVNGHPSGTTVPIHDGCRYALSTRLYASERNRIHPTFFQAEGSIGQKDTPASVRVVLECREIDPANPATLAQPAVVLYDDIIDATPTTCRYVLVASKDLQASINYVRIRRMPEVLVRSSLAGRPFRTRLVGGLSEGAECGISTSGLLYFYSANPPDPNEQIVVSYRTPTRAAGRAADPASIASQWHVGDDGERSSVASIVLPHVRTSEDCALAAQTWLKNAKNGGWTGKYECWSDSLPSDSEILPGDALRIIAPSRNLDLETIIRSVDLQIVDPIEERRRVKLRFADEAAEPIAIQLAREQDGMEWPRVIVDADAPEPLPALDAAAIVALTSTTLTIDVGAELAADGGVEVRRSDTGWGPDIDRNLAGRFPTRTFTLPRLARNQQYCLRQYDASTPPRYSRHTTILYVDKPL